MDTSEEEESEQDDLEEERPKKRANRGQVLSRSSQRDLFLLIARFLQETYFRYLCFRSTQGEAGRRVQRRPRGHPRTQLQNSMLERQA